MINTAIATVAAMPATIDTDVDVVSNIDIAIVYTIATSLEVAGVHAIAAISSAGVHAIAAISSADVGRSRSASTITATSATEPATTESAATAATTAATAATACVNRSRGHYESHTQGN